MSNLLDQPHTETYPPNWLNAMLLEGRSVYGKIIDCTVEDVRDPKQRNKFNQKICVWFDGWKQGFLPNKTQHADLDAATGGTIPRHWIGHTVILSPATAPNGKPTIAVSIAGITKEQIQLINTLAQEYWKETYKTDAPAYIEEQFGAPLARLKYDQAADLIEWITAWLQEDEGVAEATEAVEVTGGDVQPADPQPA